MTKNVATAVNGSKMGRPKGAMREEKKEILKLVRDLGPEAVRKLKHLMRNGATETIQFAAAQALLERGFGKPFQSIGIDTGPQHWVVSWSNDPVYDPLLIDNKPSD